MMHLASPELTAVATDPRWAPIVLPLLGTGDARLYWEQAVAKPPQARTELPWHQDNGYTPLVPEEYVTCWLALDDADARQRLPVGDPREPPAGHGPPPQRRRALPRRPRRSRRRRHPGAGARGSVLVFSSLLMHRSGPNTTDRAPAGLDHPVLRRRGPLGAVGQAPRRPPAVRRDGDVAREPVRQREFDLLAVLANYDTSELGAKTVGKPT